MNEETPKELREEIERRREELGLDEDVDARTDSRDAGLAAVSALNMMAAVQKAKRLKIETTPEELDAEAEAIANDLRAKATAAAETAVKGRVNVSVTESGKVRRNGPCPCGSGRKFKKCCLREVQDPTNAKQLPPPSVLRHYIKKKREQQS